MLERLKIYIYKPCGLSTSSYIYIYLYTHGTHLYIVFFRGNTSIYCWFWIQQHKTRLLKLIKIQICVYVVVCILTLQLGTFITFLCCIFVIYRFRLNEVVTPIAIQSKFATQIDFAIQSEMLT